MKLSEWYKDSDYMTKFILKLGAPLTGYTSFLEATIYILLLSIEVNRFVVLK
jgi:hypothetical protein